RRRRLLAEARGLRAGRVPKRRAARHRPGARDADAARARGAAADRARLPLQGDRRAPQPLGEDDRGARVERPAEAAALDAPRAHPLGAGTPPGLGEREIDLALVAGDRVDAHLDRIAEAVGAPGC